MFPLEGVRESDPENGGFSYLDFSSFQGGYHEGTDFNSGIGPAGDLGADLLACADMILRASLVNATGFGRHQWWEVIKAPPHLIGSYVHYAHAESFLLDEGDIGTIAYRGDKIGECGASGSKGMHPHLHFVVTREKPPSWGWYGAPGMSRDAVQAMTWNPVAYCEELNQWYAEQGKEPDVTEEQKAVLAAIEETGYPITEVPALIRACKEWSANADSLAEWIGKIGALEARLAELEAAGGDAVAST